MDELSQAIKQFIVEHANQINNNEWDEVFKDSKVKSIRFLSKFIQVLLKGNIDFISHMSYIPEYCFYGCSSISKIVIPKGIETIGASAFYGSYLEEISFEEDSKLKEMDSHVFCFCKKLKTCSFPEGIKELPASTFLSCDNLESLYIPGSVNKVASGAIRNCPKLLVKTKSDEMVSYCNNFDIKVEKI